MAKRYKTHEQLKISFAEYGALLGTRTLLDMKIIKLKKSKYAHIGLSIYPKGKEHIFNMFSWLNKNKHCGTASCIGGTMELILGVETTETVGLHELFYPAPQHLKHKDYDYNKITEVHAIKAIDNYLTTGKPLWEKVLPKSVLVDRS